VNFNREVLSSRTTPSFVQVMEGGRIPVALQNKDTLPPSLRVTLPYATFRDICTGTGK